MRTLLLFTLVAVLLSFSNPVALASGAADSYRLGEFTIAQGQLRERQAPPARIKSSCPPVLAQACPGDTKRVCLRTDSANCCIKSECVQK
jgi:hypothetical protein